MLKPCRRPQGVSAIELLIVVAMVSVLAMIAVPCLLEAQTRAKLARAKSELHKAGRGLEAFHFEHKWYPPDGMWPNSMWGNMLWVDDHVKPWFTLDEAKDLMYQGKLNLWRFDNCLFLTTPVAYLSSFPKDPFSEDDAWWVGSFIYSNWYDRWKLDQQNNPASMPIMLDGSRNGWAPIDGKRTFCWVVESLGPDKVANDHSGLPSFMQYDPSNGTVSKGDIFVVGP